MRPSAPSPPRWPRPRANSAIRKSPSPPPSVRRSPAEGDRTFRYASLASGLDIVRKCLGQHEIAAVQTTTINQTNGVIHLTALLAHTSGEWISSDRPVCSVTEIASLQRMGAALTYARRYGLFTLVGIAGEDDLDAPDLSIEPVGPPAEARAQRSRKPSNGSVRKPILAPASSAALRDQLIAEISGLREEEELAQWAHRRLAAKNTLTAEDTGALESAYLATLSVQVSKVSAHSVEGGGALPQSEPSGFASASSERMATVQVDNSQRAAIRPHGPGRTRNKAHLRFVAAQPCLVCQRSPCDPHHLRFAQPRALGRKVSDEFVVPLCRDHHRQLHRQGDEIAWWANLKLVPLETAKELWLVTLSARDGRGPTLVDIR